MMSKKSKINLKMEKELIPFVEAENCSFFLFDSSLHLKIDVDKAMHIPSGDFSYISETTHVLLVNVNITIQ